MDINTKNILHINRIFIFFLLFGLYLSTTTIFGQEIKRESISKELSNKEYLEENKKKLDNYSEKEHTIYDNEKKDRFFTLGGTIGSPAGANINLGYYFDNYSIRLSGMYYQKYSNGAQLDLGYIFHRTNSPGFSIKQGVSLVGGIFQMNPLKNKFGIGQLPFDRKLLELAYNGPDNLVNWNYTHNYFGLTYDLYLEGFFMQIGVAAGRGSLKKPFNCFSKTQCLQYDNSNIWNVSIVDFKDQVIKSPHLLFQIGYMHAFR